MRVLACVGTTKFDFLIQGLLNCSQQGLFKDHQVLLQTGQTSIKDNLKGFTGAAPTWESIPPDSVRCVPYITNLSASTIYREADLLFSHAGAGCILEALEQDKNVYVVINAALMDDHQTELADAVLPPTRVFRASDDKQDAFEAWVASALEASDRDTQSSHSKSSGQTKWLRKVYAKKLGMTEKLLEQNAAEGRSVIENAIANALSMDHAQAFLK